ncbi:MAG: hypothetical protein U9Q07_08385 [Planctomycetota bacterium]|nr:hypothetical protein [Planctomycetota bacterium]
MPSAEVGEVVPQLVEAAIYDWKWYYSAPGFAIWLALILAFVVPKSNRDLRVLLIFVPLAIVNLLWLAFKEVAGVSAASAVQFGTVLQSMAVGTAVLWLTGGYFKGLGGLVRFLFSFGTVVLVAGLGILSYSAEFSNETFLFLTLFVCLTLTVLAAITLTRTVCKGKYRPIRFMLWLALWMLLGSMLAMFGFFIAGSFIMSSGLSKSQFSQALLMIIIAGPILGLGLYLLNLPFMILGFVNPFFRERLCDCLCLKPAAATAVPFDAGDIAER